MIALQKLGKPQILVDNGTQWTSDYLELRRKQERDATIEGRYRHAQIKSCLIAETREKCAFCESKVLGTQFGDVEHLKPKKQYPELFVEWENLTLACSKCNNAKRDVDGILNPYTDNVTAHVQFLGPMVAPNCESACGSLTVRQLRLNRDELLTRRAKRLADLQNLIELVQSLAAGPLKDAAETELSMAAQGESEYSAFARQYLDDLGLGHLV
ncbi:HNH endonuclease signature motif containing protein [Aurantiacibacter sp. D1-12]|uniref:HNH endonuclease signature motif containing protein n=1 Tax=Aurantiacibacter sp. D1-12 TaxID=2993658 RepID=UPI00237D1016|nr:HNH endonuclease signature motif containing protein [Aurantiacibacter sp. D1-12]MDE1468457.1 HNH endonuclease signature motif containing protein [Aurantiacibacter sp. D1-12]